MNKTKKNLEAAFAGESQANRKYLAFAKKAEEEGYLQIAKLFRAVAASETVHAHNHLRILSEIKNTSENLEAAAKGEIYEHSQMYPQFIKVAKEEKNRRGETSFFWAQEAEKVHSNLYRKALENLGQNETVNYYVCSVCGYTAEASAPDRCPICNASSEKFNLIT